VRGQMPFGRPPSHRARPSFASRLARCVLLIQILLAACAAARDGPISTAPRTTPSPSEAAAHNPVRFTLTPTPIASPTPSLLSMLPAGQYLVTARRLDRNGIETVENHVLSLEGDDLGVLATWIPADAGLAPDGSVVTFWEAPPPSLESTLYLLGLRDGQVTTLLGPLARASGNAWSPEGDRIAVTIEGAIELVSVYSGQRTPLLDCRSMEGAGGCYVHAWSPDGNWLAYTLAIGRSGPRDSREGIYLLDTTCIPRPSDCPGQTWGPIARSEGAAAWSPEGRLLAIGAEERVVFFDVETWSVVREQPAPSQTQWSTLEWSPDGEWLAYNHDLEVWLLSPETGERRLLFTGPTWSEYVVFWLAVPAPGG
jgi:WD40 repeat protein